MNNANLKGVKHIHFVGIKGVGVAPLAIYANEAKIAVSGSDIADEFITDEVLLEKGISWTVGFGPEDIPQKTNLVIATGAHGGLENPQVLAARKRNIPVWMQGEALGKFMEGSFGIAVTGSHGKTTTAAMLATLLSKANFDPSYIVGCASMRPLGPAGHKGKGQYFVAEADEYANEPNVDKTPKFLYLSPKIIMATNIDFDHPDLFASIDDVRMQFLAFFEKLPSDGVAIINGDDAELQKIQSAIPARVITFGRTVKSDFSVQHVGSIPQKTTFFAKHKDVSLGQFAIGIPGTHNVQNALSVIAAGFELGLPVDVIREHLSVFQGGKRRFEYKGKLPSGAVLFDDYAHHPKEISETLFATRQWFPKAKITVIFQPHTYSRTKALFEQFAHAFGSADRVILTDIYASLREEKDPNVSSETLVSAMKKIGVTAEYIPNMKDVVQYSADWKLKEGDVVMIMGAGDIYKIAPSFFKA